MRKCLLENLVSGAHSISFPRSRHSWLSPSGPALFFFFIPFRIFFTFISVTVFNENLRFLPLTFFFFLSFFSITADESILKNSVFHYSLFTIWHQSKTVIPEKTKLDVDICYWKSKKYTTLNGLAYQIILWSDFCKHAFTFTNTPPFILLYFLWS